MKAEYVNPFASAAVNVFTMVAGVTPERGQLGARPQMFTTQQVNIVCGVTGTIEGLVLYGMSLLTASRIASKMIGHSVTTFDSLAQSAIAELGNMISGNSLSLLSTQGLSCDITPPSIIRGNNVRMTTSDCPVLLIPMMLPDVGMFEINVCLREKVVRKAA